MKDKMCIGLPGSFNEMDVANFAIFYSPFFATAGTGRPSQEKLMPVDSLQNRSVATGAGSRESHDAWSDATRRLPASNEYT
jgi:hypothetical protein